MKKPDLFPSKRDHELDAALQYISSMIKAVVMPLVKEDTMRRPSTAPQVNNLLPPGSHLPPRESVPLGAKVRVLGMSGIGEVVGTSGWSGIIVLWDEPPYDELRRQPTKTRAQSVYYDTCEVVTKRKTFQPKGSASAIKSRRR